MTKPNPSDDQKPAKDKLEIPQDAGGRGPETKVGLMLVLILLAAFSFMVWQKWNKAQQLAQNPETSHAVVKDDGEEKDPADTLNPPPQSEPKSFASTSVNEFGESTSKPASDTRPIPEVFPISSSQSKPTESHPVTKPAHPLGTTESFDPFGDSKTTSAEPAKDKPTATSDPFGDEDWKTETKPSAEATQSAAAEKPTVDPFGDEVKLPNLDFPGQAAPKTAEKSLAPSAATQEVDPFANPPQATTTTPKLPVVEDADPFAESGEKPKPGTEEKPVANPANSYQEPLPLFESEAPKTGREPVKFGEFEEVPSGHASAASKTQVEPTPGNSVDRAKTAPPGLPNSTTDQSVSVDSLRDDPFGIRSNASTARTDSNMNAYRVESNDNYWSISRKVYGTSRYYRALALFNAERIPDPQKMRPGMQVLVPEKDVLESKYPELFPGETRQEPGVVQVAGASAGLATDLQGNPVYRVGEHDTLSTIAEKHLGRSSRWIQIYELNRDKLKNPNELKIGTILKLPADASRVNFVTGDSETLRR